MSRLMKRACILAAAMVAWTWLSGCGVALKGKDIDRIELSLFGDGDKLVTSKQGLKLGEKYLLRMQVYTKSGQIIKNPNYKDLVLVSPNDSVLTELSWGLKGYSLTTSANTALMRNRTVRFMFNIRGNSSFRSKVFSYQVRWASQVEHRFDERSGSWGAKGEDGAPGADQDGDAEPQPGERGEDGEGGQDGTSGGHIKIYAAPVVDEIGDRKVRGILYKIVRGNGAAKYHYTRGGTVSISSLGGNGGSGGDAGDGGDGGNAVEVDPEVTPPEEWMDGGLGGHGGRGGDGGHGGHGADITLYYYGKVKSNFRFSSRGGRGGLGGRGGEAGAGGKGSHDKLDAIAGNDGDDGRDGAKGRDGRIQSVPVKLDEIHGHFKSLGIGKEQITD